MKPMIQIRALAVAAVLAISSGTLLAQPAAPAPGTGKVEVIGGEVYNWGKVPPGDLKTVIEVKNVGTGDLNISEVRPSCHCTASPIDKNVLKPGEIGKIAVTVDAKNNSGELTKVITVMSNDPTAPQKVIYLKADVRPLITFEPVNYFLANNVTVKKETVVSLTLRNSSDSTYTLYPPTLASGNAKVTFDMKKQQTLKPGQTLVLKAHITPQSTGAINGSIKMKTSNASRPELDFPIYGNAVEATGNATHAPTSPARH